MTCRSEDLPIRTQWIVTHEPLVDQSKAPPHVLDDGVFVAVSSLEHTSLDYEIGVMWHRTRCKSPAKGYSPSSDIEVQQEELTA